MYRQSLDKHSTIAPSYPKVSPAWGHDFQLTGDPQMYIIPPDVDFWW